MIERTGANPAEFWKQWYETGSRMWTDMLRGPQESFLDPYGLYRQWFEGMENVRQSMMEGTAKNGAGDSDGGDPSEMWRRWTDATIESWQKSAQLATEMTGVAPRWMQMMEQARENMINVESIPRDPLQLFVQWYNATSGPLSEFVHDIIEREEFLEPASRWMHSYASFYKVFRGNAEEYLRNLQIPTRSDVTRVASLVVALEEKVDRIEEAFEEFEYGYARPATEDKVEEIDKRLDRVEGKLDRLLAALENGGSPNNKKEIKATDAARRKARELGVDLAKVQGTGSDGQVTVEDVRKKGES